MVTGLKAIIFTSFLFLASLLFATQGFRLQCKAFLRLCSLENWNPDEESYFVLKHIPKFIDTLKIINLIYSSINGKFLNEIRSPLEGIIVDDSNAVKTLYVPENSTVKRIMILNSPINDVGFENNTFLQILIIVNSDLKANAPSLANLSNLNTLKIANTDIALLDLDIFYGMQKLLDLNFSTNNIRQLFSSTGASNTTNNASLKYFRLKDNKLKTIHFHLLEPFHMLALIDISWNEIESIHGTLSSPSLQWLIMMHNRITSLNFCTWNGNRNNLTLIASYNRLTQVPSCLTKFPNALEIILSHNMITHVDMTDFDGLNNLYELDLGGNKMVSLEFTDDILFRNLYALRLYENCMCQLNGTERIKGRMPLLQIRFNEYSEPCKYMCLDGAKVENKKP